MSDDPKIIAETEEYELYSDGRLMWLGGGQFEPVYEGIAALLADAVRRVREEPDSAICGVQDDLTDLDQRIEAVENKVRYNDGATIGLFDTVKEANNALVGRVEALEARQQGEAGDPVAVAAYNEAGERAEPAAWSPPLETYESKVRRELAWEIAEYARSLGAKHRQGSYGARTALNDLADWIEHEFGGEGEERGRPTTPAVGSE